MSRQPDLFDKAADCERAMNMVSDPHENIALKLYAKCGFHWLMKAWAFLYAI